MPCCPVARADTPEARRIWADVEEVAARTPQWIKDYVKERLKDYHTPEAVKERHEEWERQRYGW